MDDSQDLLTAYGIEGDAAELTMGGALTPDGYFEDFTSQLDRFMRKHGGGAVVAPSILMFIGGDESSSDSDADSESADGPAEDASEDVLEGVLDDDASSSDGDGDIMRHVEQADADADFLTDSDQDVNILDCACSGN